MKHTIYAAALVTGLMSSTAMAQGFLVSTNGLVAIGVTATGSLNTDADALGGPVPGNSRILGIAYSFSGQGGRTGFQDALSPGCECEAWGVAGNGAGSWTGAEAGTSGITGSTVFTASSITTNATGAAGLSVAQVITRGVETSTGALFKTEVTIANNTGATVTDVMYARAMDWDVPPTEFSEYVTHAGVAIGGTSLLLRATNNGFNNANPITALGDGGIGAAPDTNGDQNGISDHGSLFVFGFGDLADGQSRTFTIFYGAGANRGDAIALIGAAGAELYSLGQSSGCGSATFGTRCDDLPTFVFAFDNVGLPPVEPPPGVPAPGALGLLGLGLLGLAAVRRRRA
jgi:type IV pilus assembly protein PilY1